MSESLTNSPVDFEVDDRIVIERAADLGPALTAQETAVRLWGSGTGQIEVPPPAGPVTVIDLSALDSILRLEPDDLTCTVEAGVRRADLDDALAEKGLCLPCEGTGTVGGSFARGAPTARAPGGHTPRSLLLGFDGVLTEGLEFKSGAKVVKSVAGFDLQKVFIGSRGRLFAATRLHLKLRPLPRLTRWFSRDAIEIDAALATFRRLRLLAYPPTVLRVTVRAGACVVEACFEGHPEVVDALPSVDDLRPMEGPPSSGAPPGAPLELLAGHIRPSRLARFLRVLPADATAAVTGTGAFTLTLHEDRTDAMLATLAELEASAEIRRGRRERRGHGTPVDAAAERLMRDLARTLDPKGILS